MQLASRLKPISEYGLSVFITQAIRVGGGVRSRLRSYKSLVFQNASSCRLSAPPPNWTNRLGTNVNNSVLKGMITSQRFRGQPWFILIE